MKTHRNPPEGTSKIFNPNKDKRIGDWAALTLFDAIEIYVEFINNYADDPDFYALMEMKADGMLSDERASSHLVSMYERFPRDIVGKLYTHLKFSPLSTVRNDWDFISRTYPCPDSPDSP